MWRDQASSSVLLISVCHLLMSSTASLVTLGPSCCGFFTMVTAETVEKINSVDLCFPIGGHGRDLCFPIGGHGRAGDEVSCGTDSPDTSPHKGRTGHISHLVVTLTPLVLSVLPSTLPQVVESSAFCLAVGLCICLHQLLDGGSQKTVMLGSTPQK